MSKSVALAEIAQKIRGCFGDVDLKFALHPSDKSVADELRKIAKNSHLTSAEVKAAIHPVINRWLSTNYCGFGENVGRPLMTDEEKLSAKVNELTSEATAYISP
ncbi:hypothetical protein [Acetobacter syzygii]|uniref:hypothetical protein n=1 Tax=Acetobacter syzygii TaxID=146476 RepID=UPI00156F2A03|nr:hypothetical protein [Acetobacter syzygii]NSL91693.1 hypothetical protein [Acetobacter syzygii]